MKKSIVIIIATFFISTAAFSQIRLGPEIGLNMSSIRSEVDDTKTDAAWKAGIKIGAALDMELTDHISFQPGIYYSVKGGQNDFNFLGNNSITYRTSNLEIPLNLVLRSASPGHGAFFAFAGPYLGFGMGGTVELKNILGADKENIDYGTDDTDDLESFDLGLNLGLGYELPGGLYIRGQFGTSLVNLMPDGKAGDPTYFNTVIGASIGYMIGR